jgi:hypothetical protein
VQFGFANESNDSARGTIALLLFYFFLVEGAYTPQGSAHIASIFFCGRDAIPQVIEAGDIARTWLADFDADSRTGAAGAQGRSPCALQEPHAQGHSPWVGGLPARESAIAEAQDTHFSLELFEMMSRRVNAVLALCTTHN